MRIRIRPKAVSRRLHTIHTVGGYRYGTSLKLYKAYNPNVYGTVRYGTGTLLFCKLCTYLLGPVLTVLAIFLMSDAEFLKSLIVNIY
jgi:hypothetical protein